jgi:hypothetical protein
MALVKGMVIARPVMGGPGNRITLRIAVGSAITADTIVQFVNKGIECVAVFQDISIDEIAQAEAVRSYKQRLVEIFGPQPNDTCLHLLNALLADGPPKC